MVFLFEKISSSFELFVNVFCFENRNKNGEWKSVNEQTLCNFPLVITKVYFVDVTISNS
jgi:hypothetical protein